MRYTRQRDRYSCGPVAIVNYLKWMGYPVSLNSVSNVLKKHSQCVPDRGTRPNNLSRTLRELGKIYGFEVKRITSSIGIELRAKARKQSLKFLSTHGCSFIFHTHHYNYNYRIWHGHYTFVPRITNKYMYTVNFYSKETSSKISLDRYSNSYYTSNIFVIRPK